MASKKQETAMKIAVENGGNVSKAMREAGYSPKTAKNPKKLTESEAWKKIMTKALSDKELAKKHQELLASTTLSHMTFPPFRLKEEVEEDDSDDEDLDDDEKDEVFNKGEKFGEQLTDDDIRSLLASTNCTVRRIVHGENARHVYFWSADNRARKDALDMAYKLKGKYAAEKTEVKHDFDEDSRLIKSLVDSLKE